MACRSADDVDVALPGILEDVSAELSVQGGIALLSTSIGDQRTPRPQARIQR